MTKLPFYWIDAFSSAPLGGNPCAVVLNADSLSSETMQKIAKEMNLSETAFVLRSKNADFGARYFTPVEELPFAGHPTVAVVRALLESGLLDKDIANLSLELPAGIIPIRLIQKEDRTWVEMSQLRPQFLREYAPEKVLPIFGLDPSDLLPGAKIQTVSTGTPILMVPLRDHDALKKIHYADPQAYFELKASGDFYYPHHFSVQGVTSKGTTFARSLGTPPNGLEDAFTGSSTGCMAAYLWKYGLIEKPQFIAEQGHWMGRPGEARVEIVGMPDSIETVRLAGDSVCVIRGEIEVAAT